ncbi:inorganic phosphate transporter [Thermococcus sp. JCM 11816]|uniref:inorganic phosphate transporter n=1 Tax=Thermococcus sp. (strain JCM 11816 / KS-1) TaxID=1295125 RepID=UPI003465C6FB
MAWAIGANDSAKAVGTAVGSGILGFKRAVLLIGVFVFLGAFLGGSGVSNTVSGLARGMEPVTIGLVLFSSAITVTLASLWGNPISTTQAIIGALIGGFPRGGPSRELASYRKDRSHLGCISCPGWSSGRGDVHPVQAPPQQDKAH